jgi:hypothetical protein
VNAHAEYSAKVRNATPCTAHDLTYGGRCLACGFDPACVVTRDGFYPLGDRTPDDRDKRAKWTGEKRPPKRGEWYLSGAIVTAYRAPAGLSTPYHIARIVRVVVETVTREV